MNDANVYAPPQTDIRQNVGHEGDDPALKAMSTKDLKKLFNHSHTIRALIFLWCLGVALMTIAAPFLLIASTGEGKESREALTYGIICVFGAIFQAAGIYGCWHRLTWGRTLGLIICALNLPSVPIGTIIGILGLLAFGNGKRLFGPDRLTHEQLKAEVAYRKAHNIR